ncbi:carbohydrate ABC transporter permease [Paenibacillus sp. MBLB4367]|uniref:carbohydrate ABC transporter permease n=1 Tax=Paenibacillus sp. MBLB4367 TaxID=3384767 RepID=UPI00390803B2
MRLLKRKQLSLEQKKSALGVLFVTPWLLGFVFLFAIPLVQSLQYSLSNLKVEMGGFQKEFVGFQYYQELLFSHPTFNRTLIDSVSHMVVNVPSIIIFSLFAATILNQKFTGRVFARAVFFLPVVLASTVLSLETSTEMSNAAASLTGGAEEGNFLRSFELERMLLESGMGGVFVDYITGSVNRIYEIISSSGVQILIFLAGLQSISPSIYEAARIEGTTGYEAFWKITFPMLSPLILTNVVYTVIDSFNNNKLNQLIMDTAFKSLNFSSSAAMAWMYFAVTSIILSLSVWLISRKVFYYD